MFATMVTRLELLYQATWRLRIQPINAASLGTGTISGRPTTEPWKPQPERRNTASVSRKLSRLTNSGGRFAELPGHQNHRIATAPGG